MSKRDVSTQSWQRRALDRLCESHADKPIGRLTSKRVRRLRDELSATPAAAKHRLKALRAMFKWAVEEEEADHNPTLGVQAIGYVTKGHHSWTLDEVKRFEARHPPGTKARLAMALLLYTTGRREDAVRFGPTNINDGRVQYRQAKNEHRKPVDMDIPLHADLKMIIAASPIGRSTFLVTDYGKPFSPNGFGGKFKDWCRQADLPHCSAHGLRKATAARLAELGATPHEIMSITGHQTLEEVEVYTHAAGKKALSNTAMARLK
jgi:integrase/recombinase XerD